MKFRDAKRLRDGDRVKIKATGEVVRVLGAHAMPTIFRELGLNHPTVFVEVEKNSTGWYELEHTEVQL